MSNKRVLDAFALAFLRNGPGLKYDQNIWLLQRMLSNLNNEDYPDGGDYDYTLLNLVDSSSTHLYDASEPFISRINNPRVLFRSMDKWRSDFPPGTFGYYYTRR